LPSEHTELKAICAAAGILYYSDLWTSNYFQRGGVKPTLIAMKGLASPTVRDENENVFDKFVRNISKLRAKVFNAESMDIKPLGGDVFLRLVLLRHRRVQSRLLLCLLLFFLLGLHRIQVIILHALR